MPDVWDNHDPKAPFPSDKFETLREIYSKMPTFRKDDWSIAAADVKESFRQLKWPRTDVQLDTYERYTVDDLGGRVTFEQVKGLVSVCHEGIPWFRHYITISDRNQDGFIHKDEFDAHIETFKAHYPDWPKTYEDFVKEADINHDGKVSVEESVKWAEKHAPKE